MFSVGKKGDVLGSQPLFVNTVHRGSGDGKHPMGEVAVKAVGAVTTSAKRVHSKKKKKVIL